jgi:hypothetical protein
VSRRKLQLEPKRKSLYPFYFALLAVSVCSCAKIMNWRGGDYAAHVYYVKLFQSHGFTLWDNNWYAGHWTISYSVLFPPVAAALGLFITGVLCAGVASSAFYLATKPYFKRFVFVAPTVFALGTGVQFVVGQFPFLMGEALGISAIAFAQRKRWSVAMLLSLSCPLASPLAGAFLCLALASWWICSRSLPILATLVSAALPIFVSALLFQDKGSFLFPRSALLFIIALCAIAYFVVGDLQILRVGCVLYAVCSVFLYFIPNPIGGNMQRLALAVGVPLVVGLAWSRTQLVAALISILVLFQWRPAIFVMRHSNNYAMDAAYYAPLLRQLSKLQLQNGEHRIEVVPTARHWEAAYVAPNIAIARGWERQLDTKYNALFYRHTIEPSKYDHWLKDNGVEYVALPDSRLDFGGFAEARLIKSGRTGLAEVWSNDHWRLFKVANSTLSTGSSRVLKIGGANISVRSESKNPFLVRIRWNPRWRVTTKNACVSESDAGWIQVHPLNTETIRLKLSLFSKNNC